MAYYRNLTLPLDTTPPIPTGAVFPEDRLSPKAIEVLERMGKIAKISTPPLSELPGWKTRAEKLAAQKIEKPEDFLDTPDADLAKLLKVNTGTVERWKMELAGWLTAPSARKSG